MKHGIHPQLAHLATEVACLTADPRNANEHGPRSIDGLIASLSDHGQRKAIVVQTKSDDGTAMVIRAGNGTVEAARRLGWTHVAAVVIDEPDVKAIAFAITDNRTAEHATWNVHVLGDSLAYLDEHGVDLDRVGFYDYEAAPIMAVEWNPPDLDDKPIDKPEKRKAIKFTKEQWTTLEGLLHERPTAEALISALSINQGE